MHVLQGIPRLLELLMEAQLAETRLEFAERHEKTKKIARDEAAFAVQQINDGFPQQHASALVTLWAGLEAAIEDMLVGILLNEPDILRRPNFSKTRVTLADFELLEREDRMRFLVSELSQDQGQGGRSRGVDYFEASLAPFDLAGPVDDDVKKLIWTAQNLRNIILHRSSIADRRLIESCPWLPIKAGDAIIVRSDELYGYGRAFAAYVLTIARRLGTRYDVDVDARIRRYEERSQP